MADYAGLKTEIAKPAYNGMTDAQIATAITTNTVTTTLSPLVLNGPAVYNSIVPSEFTALAAAQQQNVRDVFELGVGIDCSAGTNARLVLLNAFAAGSATRANLLALAQVTKTIAQSLGFNSNNDMVQEIAAARSFK